MSDPTSPPLTGSCLCGEAAYQVDQITDKIAHCHCSMCRKFHGAAFSTFAETHRSHFKWLRGEALLSKYLAPNGTVRQFCRMCGSSLTFSSNLNQQQTIEFALGTLDGDSPQLPDAHIYIANKANWLEFNDSLPHHLKDRE